MVADTLISNLASHGISAAAEVVHNPDYDLLFNEETSSERTGFDSGRLTTLGAVAVDTGEFTGRSPKDKYFVKDATTRDTIWWSDQGKNDNKPLSQETWSQLKSIIGQQLSGKRLLSMISTVAQSLLRDSGFGSSPRWPGSPTSLETCLSGPAHRNCKTSCPILRCLTGPKRPTRTGRHKACIPKISWPSI